ncbi:MAG: cobalamin B12-binding domain-containing protein [Candidatus Tectomicrobia bacterium]|uniref:Cobalamin B12-binding domain-containing protein n=1 Tax=Tectimicrobiota bacterium TaxID=2528274 RepID=A0A933LQD8_UNCTE|nr:cobalamin B12-binding domain-containing protein [Candidatus Tectomicrobia bacterium]
MKEGIIKVLIAKPGLDGHDRGAKVVAQALRDAGMEVVYTGLKQTIDQIVVTAIQEDVDVIGLSILSGAHVSICERVMKRLKQEGMTEVLVVVGGNILKRDAEIIYNLGVKGVFPVESSLEDIVKFIRENAPATRH